MDDTNNVGAEQPTPPLAEAAELLARAADGEQVDPKAVADATDTIIEAWGQVAEAVKAAAGMVTSWWAENGEAVTEGLAELVELAHALDPDPDPGPDPDPDPGPDPDPDPGPDPDPDGAGGMLMIDGPVGLPVGSLAPSGPGHDDTFQLAPYFTTYGGATAGVSRGRAPISAPTPTSIAIGLSIVGQGTTPTHQGHFHFPSPLGVVTSEISYLIEGPDLADTGKEGGGLVGFDGDWGTWPGGGTMGPNNWMVRAVHNHWHDGPGQARLVTLIKLGGPFGRAIVETDGFGGAGTNPRTPRRYLSSSDWVLQTYLDGFGDLADHVGDPITVRYVAGFGADGDPTDPGGWLDCYVRTPSTGWQLVQSLAGIRWATNAVVPGWNRGYYSFMLYNDDPSGQVDNVIELLRTRYWAGAHRPPLGQ